MESLKLDSISTHHYKLCSCAKTVMVLINIKARCLCILESVRICTWAPCHCCRIWHRLQISSYRRSAVVESVDGVLWKNQDLGSLLNRLRDREFTVQSSVGNTKRVNKFISVFLVDN